MALQLVKSDVTVTAVSTGDYVTNGRADAQYNAEREINIDWKRRWLSAVIDITCFVWTYVSFTEETSYEQTCLFVSLLCLFGLLISRRFYILIKKRMSSIYEILIIMIRVFVITTIYFTIVSFTFDWPDAIIITLLLFYIYRMFNVVIVFVSNYFSITFSKFVWNIYSYFHDSYFLSILQRHWTQFLKNIYKNLKSPPIDHKCKC